MIAVDTNILVYAHRADGLHHGAAYAALESLATRGVAWAVPWPCLHEFLAVVTHPRLFDPPSSLADALGAFHDLLGLAGMHPLAEEPDHADLLVDLLTTSGVTGPKVHDARVAAICLSHGVDSLWTADRDFSFFPQLRTHNPLVA